MIVALNVSDENAIAYVCLTIVALAAIAAYTILVVTGKVTPPTWLGGPDKKDGPS